MEKKRRESLMILFIFLAILFGVRSDECLCDQTEYKCIPSISNLGKTINLFNGEMSSYGFSAVQFSCGNKTYYDSITGETFIIYKEMAVDPQPYGEITTEEYYTSESMAKALAVSVHADGEYSFYKASVDVQRIDESLIEKNSFYTVTQQQLKIFDYKLTLPLEFQTPSEEFTKIVDTFLPEEFDEEKYFKAIDTVLGTHVLVQTTVGGTGIMKTDVSYEYLKHKTQTDLKVDAGVSFVNLQGGVQHNTTSEDWKNSTSTTALIYGGDPQFTRFDQWEKWIPSIRKQPVKISYTVEPVHNLIQNKQKRQNYINAIARYSANLEPTIIQNCTHWSIQQDSPPHTIEKIGPVGDVNPPYFLYLVEGPDYLDRCLVALNYGKENRFVMKDLSRSSYVEVEGIMFFSHGSGKVEIKTNVGSCYGTKSISGEQLYSCRSKVNVKKNKIVYVENLTGSQSGCWPGCDLTYWGAVLQPRTISN